MIFYNVLSLLFLEHVFMSNIFVYIAVSLPYTYYIIQSSNLKGFYQSSPLLFATINNAEVLIS